jgi:carbon starvation protein
MNRFLSFVVWTIISCIGAVGYCAVAFSRKEPLNSVYILMAALCTYAIGYRFYSKWIAAKVLVLNDRRATPCEVHEDGRDFVKTNKWIVFGHHFAAISGPGPLVGPVLAAQFGYLPGTLWILIGVLLGGAVQDFVILFCSMRRNGKSLGEMVKEEINTVTGALAMFAILAIMVIILAVLALVVVRALAESPWGIFTVGSTIPIAMFMGLYLRYWRVGKVREASAIGVILLLLAVWGGKFFHQDPSLAGALTLKPETLGWAIIGYGLAASALPVWLLLAPRDYLSTFMKLGTIGLLVVGIFCLLPTCNLPAMTKFIDGTGPVFAGKLFPFCFITIACGAISGFHSMISSGTTPKIITRESYARPVGYGAMCLESLVAIMALIAACSLDPGVYFSMNIKGDGAATVAQVTALGYPVTEPQMKDLATTMGETTLFGRTGGAATLAVGMAHIFSKLVQGRWLDLWYHFAIMFEALFILTTVDAGTRVSRYLLQDILGHVWKPLGETHKHGSTWLASCLIVGAWGFFLIQGIRDPLGGINSLWPLFGIANQLLAAIALCLATTIILKMQLKAATEPGAPRKPRLAIALVTFIPLVALLAITMTAGVQKVAHPDVKIGFLAQASLYDKQLPALQTAYDTAKISGNEKAIANADKALHANRELHFNAMLDAVVTSVFLVVAVLVTVLSVVEWVLLLARIRPARLHESEAVWLPDYAVAETRKPRLWGLLALAVALGREWSGESAVERAEQAQTAQATQAGQTVCECHSTGTAVAPANLSPRQQRQKAWLTVAEKRFKGVNRCC